MSEKRVVLVVDMQNGVFKTPRHQSEKCVSLINQLTQAAEAVIFIQHTEAGGLEEGSEGFALLPDLNQPAGRFTSRRPLAMPSITLRSRHCCANRRSMNLLSAAARRIIVSMPPLKTVSAGATTSRLRRMPTPRPIVQRPMPRF